jgi:heme/copper-type cytochrome/quinol oxidase subunit 3
LISIFNYPLYNTVLLITSGFAVTWVHRGIAIGSFKQACDGFIVTILLGIFFVLLQVFEYIEAMFNITTSIYSCTFFMLTGLHGCHVIIGVIFLTISFCRLLLNHYLVNHYLGLVCAI